jgi:hypothetical protein
MDNNYHLLDSTVYGRQEKWEDSPAGWPQQCTYTDQQRLAHLATGVAGRTPDSPVVPSGRRAFGRPGHRRPLNRGANPSLRSLIATRKVRPNSGGKA